MLKECGQGPGGPVDGGGGQAVQYAAWKERKQKNLLENEYNLGFSTTFNFLFPIFFSASLKVSEFSITF